MIPLRTDSRVHTTPWVNWALIVANIAAYMLQRVHPALTQRMALDPAQTALPTFLTYAFAHASIAHIAGNVLFLYIFGNAVNDKMGQSAYLAFYLSGAVIAGVGHVLSASHPVIGASGAVAAVT